MWLWILIGFSIITKVHGFSSGAQDQSCGSMSPVHSRGGQTFAPQNSESPFKVTYKQGNVGEPITVILQSKQATKFRGYMLEAREKDRVDEGQPVGKFIMLDSTTTQLLTCSGFVDSAVTQANNQRKTSIRVNWTAQQKELDITFRATFVKSLETFWERVDVNVTLPQHTTLPPSTTTSTEPSTTTSTTQPSTTSTTQASATSTTQPSTTSTTQPSTTSTTQPSTTSTTQPSTTSTTQPSTTSTTQASATSTTQASATSTTQPSATSTTQPSTTSTTQASTTSTTRTPVNNTKLFNIKCQRAASVLLNFDNIFVAVKLEMPNILTTTFTNSPFLRHLNKVSNISYRLLCAAVEISSLILLCVGDSIKVTIALVCVAIAINFIELIIVSLPIGPSHELKEICDLAVKMCSVIHMIFTTAAVFTGVLEIDNCSKNRIDSWLLKVMVAYTAWIFLFVIWVFVFSTHRPAILRRSKIGSSKNSERWRQQRKKKKLSAAEVIVTAISVIVVIGNVCFAVAVIVGIFVCQKK